MESSQLTQHSNPTIHIRGPIAILCVKVSEPKFQLSCCRRACSWSRYVSVVVPCRWNDREKAATERGKTLHQAEIIYNYIYIYNIHATYIVLPFRVLDELGGATFASDTIIFQDLAGKLVVSSMYCNSMLICKLERP